MLDRLTAASFTPHIGDVFVLRVDAQTAIEARLTSARAAPGSARGPAGRVPFSIEFLGPRDPVLPQRIYRVEHPVLGALDIFLVPVGRDADGVTYEAVFN